LQLVKAMSEDFR